MPMEVARFFVSFLSRPGDLVLDPFAGSNVTGAAAEELGRHWLSIEADRSYVRGSLGRFQNGLASHLNYRPHRIPSMVGARPHP
jgi:DNA modification methylase